MSRLPPNAINMNSLDNKHRLGKNGDPAWGQFRNGEPPFCIQLVNSPGTETRILPQGCTLSKERLPISKAVLIISLAGGPYPGQRVKRGENLMRNQPLSKTQS